jgi:AraC-like DNA-binding protein
MKGNSRERARFIRPTALDGVEALHATFVSHRYPRHLHEVVAVASVTLGAATFELEGQRYTAPAGTVFVIPPNSVHTGETATPYGYTYQVLYLEPIGVARSLGYEVEAPIAWQRSLTVMKHPALGASLSRLHGAMVSHEPDLEQGEALLKVVREILETYTAPLQTGSSWGQSNPGVARAREFILTNWRENSSVVEIAAVAGLSPFHLVRQFQSKLGMPPSAFRRALRVQIAQRMLRQGESVASVALACGFYDQAHLTRHFTRMVGVSPHRYAAAG